MSRYCPLNLTLEQRNHQRELFISKALAKYFSSIVLTDKFDFFSEKSKFVSVSNVRRLSSRTIGNDVYSFVFTYRDLSREQQINFILKAYGKSLDPVLRASSNNENLERCVKEFQVLRGLESVNFPVPKAYICEDDLQVLGYPFIITLKEELNQNVSISMDCFAKTLFFLHTIPVGKLGVEAINSPGDMYAFARQNIFYIKTYLNLYPIHKNKGLQKIFDLAIRWLESNVTRSFCPKYCLIHGDYRAGFNTFLTRDSGIVVTDWEDATIGDPAYDVGSAYVRERVDLGKKNADRFVQEYLRYHEGDFAERIFFYELVAYLRLAVTHNAILSNPLRAYEIRGPKAFILFPFSYLHIFDKRVGTDLDNVWVNSFEEFVKENLK